MARAGPRLWSVSLLLLLVDVLGVDAQHTQLPEGLPCYDLQIVLDVAEHLVKVRQVVTWTNRTKTPTPQIVFNAHAHYSIPDKDIGLLAKTVEFLRMSPKESMSFDGPAMEVRSVRWLAPERAPNVNAQPPPVNCVPLTFHHPEEKPTSLVVPLTYNLQPGEAVRLELEFTLKLPPRKGRWGQWDGITTLAQWLPTVAVFDDVKGWQPTPFIPWHQPFFNEAGHYTCVLTLPCAQKVACSAVIHEERDLGNGWKEVLFEPICVRDFALICCDRFQEWTDQVEGVTIRCLAFPEHEFYAKTFVESARDAIPIYNRWFGKYPYSQFTVAEACFGWNGNECGALVMIDDRMFGMPHMARSYPYFLLQHELCHQWWYNVVGTNGYTETWMDEAMATYFSHRLANQLQGRNNSLLQMPAGLTWLPNITRDDFRNYGMVGTWARGQGKPCVVEDMPAFGHLVNLTSAAYDRGSKVVGMIEERLGELAFMDFNRRLYRKYQFRILRVADYQAELEAYTGRSWQDFFQHWLYGTGRCDWIVDDVAIDPGRPSVFRQSHFSGRDEPVRVVVKLRQQGEYNEPTTLGFRLVAGSEYQVRVPIYPNVPVLYVDNACAVVTCTTDMKDNQPSATVTVEILLPYEPLQVSVDPDQILLDCRPTNNHWKQLIRWHATPFLTQLDEVDVTNAYDRWNVHVGPWGYMSTYSDPWFTKSDMLGLRASMYRTQEFMAGTYVAYRTDQRNVAVGADALWDHVLDPNFQVGMNVERSVSSLYGNSAPDSRGVLYGRYVMMYGSSLYMPPFEYVEAFAMMQDRTLPVLNEPVPQTNPYNERPSLGINYHKNLLTPYWDAEGGFLLDVTYQYGVPILGNSSSFHELYGQFSFVKSMPKFLDGIADGPFVRWLYDSRFAFRLGGAAGLPNSGLLFPLGGSNNFRGFDLSERQGNLMWVGSAEWRVPVLTNLHWDFCDHVVGVRNIYLAPFYDVGNSYVNGQELGSTAHAVGLGLRVDISWLGLIERTMFRVDVAKTINSNSPLQIWFGLSQPF